MLRIGILRPEDTPAVGKDSGSADWTPYAEEINRRLKAEGKFEDFLDARWASVVGEILAFFRHARWTVELDPPDSPERMLRINYVPPPPPPPPVVRPEETPAATAEASADDQPDGQVGTQVDGAINAGSVQLCACGDGCFTSQLDPAAAALLNPPPQSGMDGGLDLNSLGQGCRSGEAVPCLACALGQPCLSGIDGDRPSIELSAVGALTSVGLKVVDRDGGPLSEEAVPGQALLLVGDQADALPSGRTVDQPSLVPSAARDTQQTAASGASTSNPAIAGLVVSLLIAALVVAVALMGTVAR